MPDPTHLSHVDWLYNQAVESAEHAETAWCHRHWKQQWHHKGRTFAYIEAICSLTGTEWVDAWKELWDRRQAARTVAAGSVPFDSGPFPVGDELVWSR